MTDSRGEARPRRGGVEWAHRATARDVATLAGVSTQTVSRVANGAANVREDTRARVVQAMETVGYTPNGAARTLRSGRSDVIGLVAHHLSRTGEAHIAEAVASTAHERGYAVSLAHARSGTVDDLNVAIGQVQRSVAGLVVVGMEIGEPERLAVPPRMPVVIADTRVLTHPTVGSDQTGGARLAVTHLLGLGHETVHLVSGPEHSVSARQRADGWRTSLEAAGRNTPRPFDGDWTPASGYVAGRRIAENRSVTAVLCANDEMAAGVMRALHETGRRIPEDVSVVGFDDVLAEYMWPPLTSVRQDFRGIGSTIVALLLAHIGGAHGAGAGGARGVGRSVGSPMGEVPPPRLVVRGSTAPPPRIDG